MSELQKKHIFGACIFCLLIGCDYFIPVVPDTLWKECGSWAAEDAEGNKYYMKHNSVWISEEYGYVPNDSLLQAAVVREEAKQCKDKTIYVVLSSGYAISAKQYRGVWYERARVKLEESDVEDK